MREGHYKAQLDGSIVGLVADMEKQLVDKLADLNARLEGREFLVGEEYSIADLVWTCFLGRIDMLRNSQLHSQHTHLNKWLNNMKCREN
mmetsp:Transcript_105038/g.226565  ORF Transcript_105038/g.226565 Transcript_105038/m.226565 type:complete len:89 (+) Transcript_105038:498-764(+)